MIAHYAAKLTMNSELGSAFTVLLKEIASPSIVSNSVSRSWRISSSRGSFSRCSATTNDRKAFKKCVICAICFFFISVSLIFLGCLALHAQMRHMINTLLVRNALMIVVEFCMGTKSFTVWGRVIQSTVLLQIYHVIGRSRRHGSSYYI